MPTELAKEMKRQPKECKTIFVSYISYKYYHLEYKKELKKVRH